MEEAGAIQNIWKKYTYRIIKSSPSRACSAHLRVTCTSLPCHRRYVSLEGDVVPAKVETSRERTSFEDAHPGRIYFFTISPVISEIHSLWIVPPLEKQIGCHPRKRSVLGVSSKTSYNFLGMDRYGYETSGSVSSNPMLTPMLNCYAGTKWSQKRHVIELNSQLDSALQNEVSNYAFGPLAIFNTN